MASQSEIKRMVDVINALESKKTLYIVLGVLTFGLFYNSFFIVSEKERAIAIRATQSYSNCS